MTAARSPHAGARRAGAPRADARTPVPFFAGFVEGRRGQILDAALSVFAEKGYQAGTMREIAERVGVTEPALYRHYAGKSAIFADLLGLAAERVVSQASALLARVRPDTLRSSMCELLAIRRSDVAGQHPVIRTLIVGAPHDPACQALLRARLARPMLEEVAAFIPRVDAFFGIERPAPDTRARARAFMSLFVGHLMTSLIVGDDADEAVVDALLAMMGWPDEVGGAPLAPGTGRAHA